MFSLTENVFAITLFSLCNGDPSLPWGVKFWQFRRFGGVPSGGGGGRSCREGGNKGRGTGVEKSGQSIQVLKTLKL